MKSMMGLSNVFELLKLDVEDDDHEVANGNVETSSSKSGKKGKSKKNARHDLESKGPSCSSQGGVNERLRLPLVWIDLEMTGLDIGVDRILEIACIITDGSLNKTIEGPDLIIHQSKECLDKMGEWCQIQHSLSGLKKQVIQSKVVEKDAEEQIIDFLNKNLEEGSRPLLAGNSVYVDYEFLKKYMPNLASMFPHVLVDVSSVKALCFRWFPGEHKRAPEKQKNHRAMDDIRESIAELKYLKGSIFKATKR